MSSSSLSMCEKRNDRPSSARMRSENESYVTDSSNSSIRGSTALVVKSNCFTSLISPSALAAAKSVYRVSGASPSSDISAEVESNLLTFCAKSSPAPGFCMSSVVSTHV